MHLQILRTGHDLHHEHSQQVGQVFEHWF
jgi:hypothetical protein